MKKKYPYPIKDFRKPKQYPDPDKKHPAQLAWEFLRRNPRYQEDFDKFKKLKSPSAKSKLQQKWLPGLPMLKLFDPKDNKPRGLKLALTHSPRFHVPHGKGIKSTESLYKGDVFVSFNLNIPIKRQLEKTGKFLEQERKKQKIKPIEKNPQKHLFPHYWRLLDAKANGKSKTELIKYFYSDRIFGDLNYKIKGELKQASLLRDSGYVFLADTP